MFRHGSILSENLGAARVSSQRKSTVHLVAQKLSDLSAELASVGQRDAAFPLAHGRGDQVTNPIGGPDPREPTPKGLRTRDIFIPDLHIETIKVKGRNFH